MSLLTSLQMYRAKHETSRQILSQFHKVGYKGPFSGRWLSAALRNNLAFHHERDVIIDVAAKCAPTLREIVDREFLFDGPNVELMDTMPEDRLLAEAKSMFLTMVSIRQSLSTLIGPEGIAYYDRFEDIKTRFNIRPQSFGYLPASNRGFRSRYVKLGETPRTKSGFEFSDTTGASDDSLINPYHNDPSLTQRVAVNPQFQLLYKYLRKKTQNKTLLPAQAMAMSLDQHCPSWIDRESLINPDHRGPVSGTPEHSGKMGRVDSALGVKPLAPEILEQQIEVCKTLLDHLDTRMMFFLVNSEFQGYSENLVAECAMSLLYSSDLSEIHGLYPGYIAYKPLPKHLRDRALELIREKNIKSHVLSARLVIKRGWMHENQCGMSWGQTRSTLGSASLGGPVAPFKLPHELRNGAFPTFSELDELPLEKLLERVWAPPLYQTDDLPLGGMLDTSAACPGTQIYAASVRGITILEKQYRLAMLQKEESGEACGGGKGEEQKQSEGSDDDDKGSAASKRVLSKREAGKLKKEVRKLWARAERALLREPPQSRRPTALYGNFSVKEAKEKKRALLKQAQKEQEKQQEQAREEAERREAEEEAVEEEEQEASGGLNLEEMNKSEKDKYLGEVEFAQSASSSFVNPSTGKKNILTHRSAFGLFQTMMNSPSLGGAHLTPLSKTKNLDRFTIYEAQQTLGFMSPEFRALLNAEWERLILGGKVNFQAPLFFNSQFYELLPEHKYNFPKATPTAGQQSGSNDDGDNTIETNASCSSSAQSAAGSFAKEEFKHLPIDRRGHPTGVIHIPEPFYTVGLRLHMYYCRGGRESMTNEDLHELGVRSQGRKEEDFCQYAWNYVVNALRVSALCRELRLPGLITKSEGGDEKLKPRDLSVATSKAVEETDHGKIALIANDIGVALQTKAKYHIPEHLLGALREAESVLDSDLEYMALTNSAAVRHELSSTSGIAIKEFPVFELINYLQLLNRRIVGNLKWKKGGSEVHDLWVKNSSQAETQLPSPGKSVFDENEGDGRRGQGSHRSASDGGDDDGDIELTYRRLDWHNPNQRSVVKVERKKERSILDQPRHFIETYINHDGGVHLRNLPMEVLYQLLGEPVAMRMGIDGASYVPRELHWDDAAMTNMRLRSEIERRRYTIPMLSEPNMW